MIASIEGDISSSVRGRLDSRRVSICVTALLTLAASLAVVPTSWSQGIEIDAVGIEPSECIVGEEVTYVIQFLVKGDGAAPEAPTLPTSPDWDATFRTTQSRGTNSSMIISNGRTTRSQTTTFQHLYTFKPKSVGRHVVPSFEWEVGGTRLRIPNVAFNVSKEAPGNRYATLEVIPSTTTPYVNEPVKLKFVYKGTKRICTKPRVTIPWAASPNGFYADPLPSAQTLTNRNGIFAVTLNDEPFGLDYVVGAEGRESDSLTFERTVYPLAPGKVELGASSIAHDVATRLRQDVFGQLVPQDAVRVVLSSKPIVLDVKEAPTTGRPSGYSGVVGNFRCDARYGKTEIKAGDGVTLSLSIRGSGDLESLVPPTLEGFDAFDVYPPDKKVESTDGAKVLTISWLIVPRTVETKELPRFEFSWFQPSSATYQTVSAGPAGLTITGTMRDEGVFGGVRTDSSRTEIRTLAEGIRPLKQRPGTFTRGMPRASLWLVIVPTVLLMISLLGTSRILDRRRAVLGDERLLRRRHASRAATARLQEAHALLGQGRDFHGKLSRSLAGFLADKLGMPPASVSPATAPGMLDSARVPSDLSRRVLAALEEFEALQFGGGSPTEADQAAALARVEGLIAELDRTIKS